VEPARTTLPELERHRDESIPAPERRERHLVVGEPSRHIVDERLELGAVYDRS
jgi:hypothetical protein